MQRFFGIEEEWKTFKTLIKPHKFKILALTLFIGYPYYKPYLISYYNSLNVELQAQLHQTKPIHKISESFLKEVVQEVLRDPQIRREGGLFVENLAKRQIVLDAIVKLLVEAVKDPHFLQEAKGLGKILANDIINDKIIQQDVTNLVIKVLRDPEVKNELSDLVKWVIQQEETKKEVIDLFRNGFQEPKMQEATKALLANAFYEVLMDKETVEKVKLFSYYLIENENKGQQGAKSLINMIIDKTVKGYKAENKDTELKRILRGEGNQDVFESIDERKKNAGEDKDDSERKFFFF